MRLSILQASTLLLLVGALFSSSAFPACTVSDFDVKISHVKWVDNCRTQSCPMLRGAAVVTSRCASVAGVQIRFVGLDANKQPVAVTTPWPFSTNNIESGEHPISLDNLLEYDAEIKTFTVEVIKTSVWNR